MINIFIFRRDFRIFDNTSLNLLKKTYPNMKILPIFIFNKNQIEPSKNPYYSSNAFEFMCDSLLEIPSLNCYLTNDDISILKELQSKFAIPIRTDGLYIVMYCYTGYIFFWRNYPDLIWACIQRSC